MVILLPARVLGLMAALAVLGFAQSSNASELRYEPRNPSFGGSPLNGSFLLNQAQIQKQYEEDRGRSVRPDTDPIDEFADTLQRRLLSQLSGDVVERVFDLEAPDNGRFTVGSTVVDYNRSGGDVELTITDQATGNTTTVSVPTGL